MKNPIEDNKRSYRVFRGGYWRRYPYYMRASFRDDDDPTYRYNYLGFRIARNKQ